MIELVQTVVEKLLKEGEVSSVGSEMLVFLLCSAHEDDKAHVME